MLIELLLCLLLALIPAAFSYLFDYAIGHPMSDKVNVKAILFSYSYFMAKRKLPIVKQKEIVRMLEPLLNSDDPDIRREGVQQLKLSIVSAGKEYFTYEQALGMCIFCTNFWLSLFAALIMYFSIPMQYIDPIFFFLFIPIFSHLILRKF